MTKNPKVVSTSSKTKKPKIASSPLVTSVEKLIEKATSATAKTHLQSLSEDKLFEVLALAKLLVAYKRSHVGGQVVHVPPVGAKSSNVVVAGGPASRNRKKFSHFELRDGSTVMSEIWVSLEVHSLSWDIAGKKMPVPLAGRHELDVAIVDPGQSSYPNHDEIQAAVTCKNRYSTSKEQVREALGLRRETAYFRGHGGSSRTPWLIRSVPSSPASPLILASSDVGVKKYRAPVDQFGVYVRYLRFNTYI